MNDKYKLETVIRQLLEYFFIYFFFAEDEGLEPSRRLLSLSV